jgi:hypothetical protein
MSYARFAEGDVYVYKDIESKNMVCIQETGDKNHPWTHHETNTKEEMLIFLNELKDAGKNTTVAIERLTTYLMY